MYNVQTVYVNLSDSITFNTYTYNLINVNSITLDTGFISEKYLVYLVEILHHKLFLTILSHT